MHDPSVSHVPLEWLAFREELVVLSITHGSALSPWFDQCPYMVFPIVPVYCALAHISGQPQVTGSRLVSDGTEQVSALEECTKCSPTGLTWAKFSEVHLTWRLSSLYQLLCCINLHILACCTFWCSIYRCVVSLSLQYGSCRFFYFL